MPHNRPQSIDAPSARQVAMRSHLPGMLLLAAAMVGCTDKPKVFCMNAQTLAESKRRLANNDPLVLAAYERLLAKADKALTRKPVSVMDKPLTPPSGDKHDYMSFGPYWWPDPAKPDGLPYIRRDGQVNPDSRKGDKKNLGAMSSVVETLTLAYYFSGKQKYAARAARWLRAWFIAPETRMNPNLRFGQAIPGRCDGRGIGIIDTARLYRIIDAIGLLQGSPAWSPEDHQAAVNWFEAYLDWLQTSKHGRDESNTRNNHGTWYDVQVVSIALFVGKTALAEKVLKAARARRIAAHIKPDGRQPHELARTRSLDYSAMNLHGLMMLAVLAEPLGIDLWNHKPAKGGGIKAAVDYLAPYGDPKKKWPHPQITPVKPAVLQWVFRHAARVYQGDPRYTEALKQLPQNNADSARLLVQWNQT